MDAPRDGELPATTEEGTESAGAVRGASRQRVFFPILLAFALLFIVLFLAVVFEFGFLGLLEDTPRDASLLAALALLAGAMLVAGAVVLRTARSDWATVARARGPKTSLERLLLSTSSAVGALFVVAASLLGAGRWRPGFLESYQWIDLVSLGLLAALAPYGVYYQRRRTRTRRIEERFPDFLHDLAASRQAGLTMESAVTTAARGEYGALTPEIRRMADQLSWNVSFEEALLRFGERVRTPLVERAVRLIVEAARSGGRVTDVLLAAAADARELKNLDTERRQSMGLYTAVVYITFLVFLVVAAILYATFIPEVVRVGESAAESDLTGLGGLQLQGATVGQYRTFYFLASVMQGLGNGLMAGMLESGRALGGLRHSAVMVLISYATFAFFLA